MAEWLQAGLGGLAACLLVVALTPWAIRLAPCIGALDVPRDRRRMHTRVMPRTGGIALFVAFAVCTVLVDAPRAQLLALLWGATLLVVLGVLDDVYRLSAPLKLIVQLLVATVVLGNGGGWPHLMLGAVDLTPGVWRLPVGVLWLLLLVNAHNMIDGLDGLAAGISALEAGALAFVFALQGNVPMLTMSLILAGCCVGYLPYNRHPAQVFMGDTGSQFLGLALGVLSLHVDLYACGSLGVLVPLLIFALPLSDLIFAVVRRTLRGQSPFHADRGHWHHRLIDVGMTQRQACRWLYLLCAALGTVSILICREEWYGFAVYATLGALALVVMLEGAVGARVRPSKSEMNRK